MPFGLDQAYWVDDADFDIEYHVREIALPRPGSAAQLDEQVSRLHARPLDRSRPLWEIYLISGLARNRAAVYTKIHHAAVDGVSGTELLTVLFDLTPEGREPPAAKPFQPERPPSLPVLAARTAMRLAWRPVQTARITNELVRILPTWLRRGLVRPARPPGRALRLPERSGTPRPRWLPDRRSLRDALTARLDRARRSYIPPLPGSRNGPSAATSRTTSRGVPSAALPAPSRPC